MSGQLDIWWTIGSGWPLVRCTPQYRHLVAKNSTTSGKLDIWSTFGSSQLDIWWIFGSGWPSVRCNPHSWGISQARVVLHQVSMTFGQPLIDIVVSLQLTIFMSMSSLKYTIFSCQDYVFSSVKLSQFLQYLPNYSLQSSSCFTTLKHQQSGLDIERLLTPLETFYMQKTF